MKNMKHFFCLLTMALLSLVLLAGCGSSDKKWSDAAEIDAYDTVERNGEQIDVCVCHDQKAVYLYYDDEKHDLFATVTLPTDELRDDDKDWLLDRVSFQDMNYDGYSDLQVRLSHSDMSESRIVWTWEEGTGYVFQQYDSTFYGEPVVNWPDESPEDDFTIYEGTWYLDYDLSADAYLVINGDGSWSYYRRTPGDAEAVVADAGVFTCSANEAGIFFAESTLYEDVSYLVLEFDDNILVWGDEGAYYRMES